VVVHGDGQHFFGSVLTDDVLIQLFHDPLGRWDLGDWEACRGRGSLFLCDDLLTEIDALIANVNTARTSNESMNLFLALATERASVLDPRVLGTRHTR